MGGGPVGGRRRPHPAIVSDENCGQNADDREIWSLDERIFACTPDGVVFQDIRIGCRNTSA